MQIDVKRAALSLGALFGVLHFVGVLLIVFTQGSIVEWSMAIHHVEMPHRYLTLNIADLAVGTVTAAITGAVTGALFAYLWNKLE